MSQRHLTWFFFSSRRRHTRSLRDWSSDVCSSDLPRPATPLALVSVLAGLAGRLPAAAGRVGVAFPSVIKEGSAYTAANIDSGWVGRRGGGVGAAGAVGRVGPRAGGGGGWPTAPQLSAWDSESARGYPARF